MPDFVYGDLQVTFLNTKYAQMAKMWDTRTPRESKFKYVLQHIPVKNTPSISILKKTNLKFNNNPFPLLYYCYLHDWDYTKAPIHRRANSLWRKNGRSVWHTLQSLGTGRNQTLCTISSKVIRMRASFVSLCGKISRI